MLHKFAMRISMNDRREKLRRFTLSFFSFCSDMGVEIGIGEFKVADGDLEPLLPNWLIGGDMASDLPKDALNFSGERLSAAASFDLEPDIAPASAAVDVEALASEHVEDREPEPQDRDFHSSIFLPQAMRIPGSLHIINNALEQVTEKLSHWQDFLAQLKIFEALWCCGRLQRFVNFCLRPSVLTHKCDEILRRKLGSLYTKRWGEVVYFCIRLKGVLPILRSTWDERRFLFGIDGAERNGDEGDETQENLNGRSNFDPSLLTRTLKDSFFFAYLDMILALVSMTEDIAHWAEACSCHEDVILQHGFAENQGLQGQSRKKHRMTMKSGRVLSSLFSGKADVCPMRGKRLPELVAYGAEKMLLDLSSSAIGSLFVSHRHLVSSEQWNLLTSDFEVGKSVAVLEFRLKFDWAKRLPYKLALLAFRDQALARRELGRIAAEFDEQPEDLQQNHHHITLKILKQGSVLRQQFDAWLSGVSIQDPQVEFQAACFRFVQITERLYEASHSILKRRTPPNASGPLISLQCRLLDVAAEVKISPETLVAIASKYDITRECKKLPFHLGLERHPWVWESLGKRWRLIKCLNQVLYRADPVSQFPDISHLDASNQKQKKKEKQKEQAQAKQSNRKKLPLTYDCLRACALHSHFLAVAESSSEFMFSLPAQSEDTQQQRLPFQPLNHVLTMTRPKADEFSLVPDIQTEEGQNCEGLWHIDDAVSASARTIFRVVNAKPRNRRLLSLNVAAAGAGGHLLSDDVAVCKFFEGPRGFFPGGVEIEEDQLWIGASSCSGQSQVESVQVLQHLPQHFTFEEMSNNLFFHVPKSDEATSLMYSLPAQSPGIDDSVIAARVTDLVQSESLPGTDSFLYLENSREVQSLVNKGFITCEAETGRYQLTQSGVASMLIFRLYASPSAVSKFMISDSEPTIHMMIQELENQGWEWAILPSPKKRKQEHEAYVIGEDKVWRTSGLTVPRGYLQCLLEAESLHSQFGIQCIPHGCTQEAYISLLKEEKHNPSKKLRLMLEDDLPQPQLQLLDQKDARDENVSENEHVMTVRSPGSVIVNDEDHSDIDDLEDSAERILDLIRAADEAQSLSVALAAPAPSTDSGAPGDVPAVNVNVLHIDQSPQPDDCASLAPAPSEAEKSLRDPGRVVVSMAVDDPSHGDYDWKTFKWGAFTFTSKRPSKSQSSTQGAYVWQASCPFHAKNDKTGCRKSCNVSPLTKENYKNVIYCLKAWCNEARKCKTQAEHMALSVSPTSFPLPSLIEAACIPATEKPTSKVKTDVEIFEDEKKN
jgi:hypothetical protein